MLARSICLFGTLALASILGSAPLSAQRPQNADRLDPQVVEVMDQFVREGRYDYVLKDGRTSTFLTVRVVVELERAPNDPTWETIRVGDKVPVMAQAIAQRQDAFLAKARQALDPAVRADVKFTRRLTLQYSICAELTSRAALDAVASLPGVAMVWNDNLNEFNTVEGRALTGSDSAASSGFDGAGVGIAVLDTHFDLLHPELGGSTSLPNSVVKGGWNATSPGSSIHDRNNAFDCEHGTAAASIARRYATGADLYGLVVFPFGVGTASDSDIAAAINWCVTNKNGVGGGAPIRIISMSLGGGQHMSPISSGTLHNACNTALTNDILCFASAGNDGWTNAIGSPAASTACMSVGSTWDSNAGSYVSGTCTDPNRLVDERACYSDTASFLSFYAPAENVVAAQCGGGTLFFGGTSAACPAAAGLAAQLLHARPQYIGDKTGLVALFQATGVQVIGDSSKRRINLTAAIGVLGGIEACFENEVGSNLNLGDDELAVNVALGFTFPYPGGSTTAIDICSNGFFYLQTGSSTDERWDNIRGSNFTSDPASIAPIWKDLDPSSSGGVYFNSFGDHAVITWLEVQPFNSP
ncbi:MAG: S8 family serine peptidase, partial [Planctomycetes bacterium]|nr:S8 family serine peptidase [Planctomycetota bacterium]